ncbi:DivIVA domain-containing protein [Hazenella coriacea]|uniref:DivIVA domain-containing protein n=1 Tax=Hazenella coriacea TaxID=1179467 RepID=UPI00311F15F6
MKRLTPMEIFNKDFKQSIRGYDVAEVNEFLDLVIKSYEDVLQENEYLKEQLQLEKQNRASTTDRNVAVSADNDYGEVIHEILIRLERLEQVIRR